MADLDRRTFLLSAVAFGGAIALPALVPAAVVDEAAPQWLMVSQRAFTLSKGIPGCINDALVVSNAVKEAYCEIADLDVVFLKLDAMPVSPGWQLMFEERGDA